MSSMNAAKKTKVILLKTNLRAMKALKVNLKCIYYLIILILE